MILAETVQDLLERDSIRVVDMLNEGKNASAKGEETRVFGPQLRVATTEDALKTDYPRAIDQCGQYAEPLKRVTEVHWIRGEATNENPFGGDYATCRIDGIK